MAIDPLNPIDFFIYNEITEEDGDDDWDENDGDEWDDD